MSRRQRFLFDPSASRLAVVPCDWPADFADRFWRAYPRRIAKRAAIAALERVRRSGEVAFTPLLEAVERYAESVAGKDPQYTAHASTWLNQGRWEDEPTHLGNTYHGQRKLCNAEGWANRRRTEIEGHERTNRPRLIASNTRSGV
jgi:hypothetical protein